MDEGSDSGGESFLDFVESQLDAPDTSDLPDFRNLTNREVLDLATAKLEELRNLKQGWMIPRSVEAWDADSIRRAAQEECRRRGF